MARRAGIMTRYVEYRYPFVFLPVSFWVSPKKEGGRKTMTATAHAASRQHAPEGRRRVLTSTIQICSIVNTGTPHRRAEPHCKHYPSYSQVKRGCGLSLSPGVSAGRSETAPGISTDTPSRKGKHSEGKAFRKGSHRIGWYFLCCIQQVRERQPKPNTAGGSNFRNHPLWKRRPLYTGVTFKRPSSGMFFKITAVGRLSLRQSDGYGKQGKRHGTQKRRPSEKR